MTKSLNFILIFASFAILVPHISFGQGVRDKDKEKPPAPGWAPSFPGFGRPRVPEGPKPTTPDPENWRGNEVGVDRNEDEEDKYNEDYPPLVIPSTTSNPNPRPRSSTRNIYDEDEETNAEDWRGPARRTSTPKYYPIPTTTTRYYPPTTTTALPWYKKFGNYAKKKFHTVYEKISG